MIQGDELIGLADLLGVYPEIKERNFQQKISAKKEFAELASDPKERLSKSRGGFFKHQELIKRYMRAYESLLLMHETGTGKTCSVGAFLEYVYEQAQERDKLRRGGRYHGGIKRAIVLVGGPNQVLEFKYQMACKCTEGQYEPRASSNEKAQKGAVTTALQDWYTIETYRKFWAMLEENYPEGGLAKDGTPSDEALERDFSDIVIWMDEVHNLRIDRRDSKKTREKAKIYAQIFRFLHVVKRSKIILSTATPMINEPYEVRHIMNLILPLNMQMGPDFDFEKANLETFRKYFQGRISFVRALDTGAIPVEVGEVIPVESYTGNYGETFRPEIKVYSTQMSLFQSKAYDRAWAKTNQEESNTDTKRSAVYQDVRQAATFVFPDGSWGGGEEKKVPQKVGMMASTAIKGVPTAGFVGGQYLEGGKSNISGYSKYIRLEGDKYKGTAEFMDMLKMKPVRPGALSLQDLSCKYYDIVGRALTQPGNFFVYCNYLHGSGAITLALALEANGFERFDSSRSIFSGREGSTVRSYCSSSQDKDKREIVPLYRGKRLRYALLSGDSQASKTAAMLEAMNSWENRHGDIIKVLIATPTARDGMNVSNVLQIHLVDSEWTPSGTYQAMSRGIRSTSHVDLIAEMVKKGVPEEEAKVEIKIFKHSSQPLPQFQRDSIDSEMYLSTEIKDRYIRRVLRIMKRLAIDCQIHRVRNVRKADADFSQTCDYDVCDYACADPLPAEGPGRDFSTYDVYYIKPALDRIIELLKKFLSTYGTIRYSDLYFIFEEEIEYSEEDIYRLMGGKGKGGEGGRHWVDDLTEMQRAEEVKKLSEFLNISRPKIMALALTRMVEERISVVDSLGYRNYVLEDRGVFFLTRDYPTDLRHSDSYDTLIYNMWGRGLLRYPLSAFLEGEKKPTLEEVAGETAEELGQRIRALPTRGKVDLLEENASKVWRETSPRSVASLEAAFGQNSITSIFRNSFFVFPYPAGQINNLEKSRANPGRGRPRNVKTVRKVQKLQEDQMEILRRLMAQDENQEPCMIHTVYSNEMKGGYNQVTFSDNAEATIRLFRQSEGAWRSVEPGSIEFEILNSISQLFISDRKKELAAISGAVYGSFYGDGAFRIHDVGKLPPKKTSSKQFENSGRECRSWDIIHLVDLCFIKGVEAPADPAGFDQQTSIRILTSTYKFPFTADELELWEPRRLSYFGAWFSVSKERRSQDELCSALKKKMIERGEIYYVF